MTTSNDCKVHLMKPEKKLERRLNGMDVLQELKKVKQHAEPQEIDNKLLCRTTNNVLDDSVQGKSCSMIFVDGVAKELEPD